MLDHVNEDGYQSEERMNEMKLDKTRGRLENRRGFIEEPEYILSLSFSLSFFPFNPLSL